MSDIWQPISETRLRASLPQMPDVSIANGTKSMPAIMSPYFWTLFDSAKAAADPAAATLLSDMCETAKVLEQVAHAKPGIDRASRTPV